MSTLVSVIGGVLMTVGTLVLTAMLLTGIFVVLAREFMRELLKPL